ncbi:hypothetical protein, partial [Porphyromonas levii]|uniref:hypothetical protein n=1 Tax=Porphyromonas levii TaxID=28114 RepID=UPI00197DEEBA
SIFVYPFRVRGHRVCTHLGLQKEVYTITGITNKLCTIFRNTIFSKIFSMLGKISFQAWKTSVPSLETFLSNVGNFGLNPKKPKGVRLILKCLLHTIANFGKFVGGEGVQPNL